MSNRNKHTQKPVCDCKDEDMTVYKKGEVYTTYKCPCPYGKMRVVSTKTQFQYPGAYPGYPFYLEDVWE